MRISFHSTTKTHKTRNKIGKPIFKSSNFFAPFLNHKSSSLCLTTRVAFRLHSNLLSVEKKTPTARGKAEGVNWQGKGGTTQAKKTPQWGDRKTKEGTIYRHIFFKHKHDLIEKFL